jgi:hypothetical protein
LRDNLSNSRSSENSVPNRFAWVTCDSTDDFSRAKEPMHRYILEIAKLVLPEILRHASR